jgi:D-serine deaminase-like pyridoxal phosphate-dependent protein
MTTFRNLDQVPSPALLFDADAIDRNLSLMLQIVEGDPSRLRPHIKTHKCGEILALQNALGIDQVKCATIAEAELAAISGVRDILISYPLVGPNVDRFFRLVEAYPGSLFSTLVDNETSLQNFLRESPSPARLFVDLDCGMHRTGISPGPEAMKLVQDIVDHPALHFAGVHAYDGHIHETPIEERKVLFAKAIGIVESFVAEVEKAIAPVPLIISGGSPTFGLHAEHAAKSGRAWQCSPGTTVLWDSGYGGKYDDLPFERAAFLLTRVVSHPGEGRVCVDLGHKSVAAENVLSSRVRFPALTEVGFAGQSEEHLVLEVADPASLPPGTPLIGIPIHVCPTVALHQEAIIVRDGTVTGEAWPIGARDRRITI